MAEIRLSQTLPYRASALFDLVADIERYPEFLPYFAATWVERRTPHAMRSVQTVGIFGLRFSFPALAILRPPRRLVVYSRNIPFRRMRARWQFRELPDGCRVDLTVDYEIYARWLEFMVRPMLKSLAAGMVTAFVGRAEYLYGADGALP